MAFWDNVKSIAIKAKCTVGWHEGEYKHIDGKPECFLGKTCPDCNKWVTEERHEFSDWEYLTYNSCNTVESCIHCKLQRTGVEHNYQKEGKDSNCHIVEVCLRCKDKKIGRAEHNWIQVPIINQDIKVDGKRKCKDCGYFG